MKRTHPVAVTRAARRIWTAIRNQEEGSQLSSEPWERRIAEEIQHVVEPFRKRADRASRDRRDAVMHLHAALSHLRRVRHVLRDALKAKVLGTSDLATRAMTLLAEPVSHFEMPLDELPDPQPIAPPKADDDVEVEEPCVA